MHFQAKKIILLLKPSPDFNLRIGRPFVKLILFSLKFIFLIKSALVVNSSTFKEEGPVELNNYQKVDFKYFKNENLVTCINFFGFFFKIR